MAQNAQTPARPGNSDSTGSNTTKDKKTTDPLFGPNIGPCSAGPPWTTTASRKKLITDDLTPEVLTSWVEKSKQVCSLLGPCAPDKHHAVSLCLASDLGAAQLRSAPKFLLRMHCPPPAETCQLYLWLLIHLSIVIATHDHPPSPRKPQTPNPPTFAPQLRP